jgi:hypothetical protein
MAAGDTERSVEERSRRQAAEPDELADGELAAGAAAGFELPESDPLLDPLSFVAVVPPALLGSFFVSAGVFAVLVDFLSRESFR